MDIHTIGVIGDGAWGTALALLLNDSGYSVRIWGYFSDYIDHMKRTRENTKFLPGPHIPESILLTDDMAECIGSAGLVILAVPSHVMRQTCLSLKDTIRVTGTEPVAITVSKGIENKTLLRMSEVINDVLPQLDVAVLSGPTHAEEVAVGIPSVAVAAGTSLELSEMVQSIFSTDRFRVYTGDDMVGVEIGGALKNIIAVAAGISDGLGFGDNTKAALITRGLAEMTRLGVAMGAKPMTFAGLSGMGDLIVTCTSRHSRNRGLGEKIGSGMTLRQVSQTMEKVAEGVKTVCSAVELAKKYSVDMPIASKVYEILYEDRNAMEAFSELMDRPLRREPDFV
ncbi:MAG: NAD(P)H-dependent glycerol-3-phosphate dehydrogenase [Candidatus Auribacterota bacterium]|jgi:glycerol-3-phosphate dehydrogenase (NAD(P)+)|nr:NAD(P)H-dependent glycerol-3-phosphate dehydrogenase [Candidatus Auribacterota bacterium]